MNINSETSNSGLFERMHYRSNSDFLLDNTKFKKNNEIE
jgi:hypothetical protein